jgi:prepilin-type N-terminal cleavage/methylation domain-containing protein
MDCDKPVKPKAFRLGKLEVGGFTLAELLIALAILGAIATFVIPKVLQSQQESKKKAVFRETLSALYEVMNTGIKTGAINANTGGTYILNHLNGIKVCRTDSSSEGCWNDGIQGVPGGSPPLGVPSWNPGVVLANNANIVGIIDPGYMGDCFGPTYVIGVVVDWNNTAGPNALGDDQLVLYLCVTGTCGCGYTGGSGAAGPGTMKTRADMGAANTALLEWIFDK